MDKNLPICPECSGVMEYYGEGGFGRCTNDKCRFEMKVDGCDSPACDDVHLKHSTVKNDPEA